MTKKPDAEPTLEFNLDEPGEPSAPYDLLSPDECPPPPMEVAPQTRSEPAREFDAKSRGWHSDVTALPRRD